jgi:sugar phosphate permease
MAARQRMLRIRQAVVIALLFGGYASLYFCRAALAVATPLLAQALVA